MTTSEEYYSKAAGCFQGIAVPKRGEYEEFDLFAIDPTEERNLYKVRIPYYFRFRGTGKGFKAKSVKPGSKRFQSSGYEELGTRSYSIFENIAKARKCLEQLEDASKKKEESEFIELLKTATNRLYDSLNALAIIVNSIYGPADYMLQPNIDNAIKSLDSKGFKDLASILGKCSKCYSLREYRYTFTHRGYYKLIYSVKTYRPEDIMIETTHGTSHPINTLKKEIQDFEVEYNKIYEVLVSQLYEFLRHHDIKIDETIAREECFCVINRAVPPFIISPGSGGRGP